jgi:diguanylate cyclase (GGDEF)-like protein
MSFPVGNIMINTFALMVLGTLCFYAFNSTKTKVIHNKIFLMILVQMIIVLAFDMMSVLDGFDMAFYPLMNSVGNFMIFLLGPLIPITWLLFVFNFIYRPEEQNKPLIISLVIIFIANAVLVFSNGITKWLYFIDTNNIYHRGSFYYINPGLIFLLLIISTGMVIFNRRRMEQQQYNALLFFSLPAFISVILQAWFYGISFMLSGTTLSLLIVFLYTQNQMVEMDYLTGVYNRRLLEIYLTSRINDLSNSNRLGAIMLDLDDFKMINDCFGHIIGDEALTVLAKLLRSSVRGNDFIARYGGDEFCIVLNHIDWNELIAIVERINHNIELYNLQHDKPYLLSLSMGYDIYSFEKFNSNDEFLNHIDRLMYQEKAKKKRIS